MCEEPGHILLTEEGGCTDPPDARPDRRQWSLYVLGALKPATLRFNVLLRRIGEASKRMLSRTRRRLEADGFAERTVYPAVWPCVEYRLPMRGRSFREPMRRLIHWAHTQRPKVEAARAAYRARAWPPFARQAMCTALVIIWLAMPSGPSSEP